MTWPEPASHRRRTSEALYVICRDHALPPGQDFEFDACADPLGELAVCSSWSANAFRPATWRLHDRPEGTPLNAYMYPPAAPPARACPDDCTVRHEHLPWDHPGVGAFLDAAIRATTRGWTVACLLEHPTGEAWPRQLARADDRVRLLDFTGGRFLVDQPEELTLLIYRPQEPR